MGIIGQLLLERKRREWVQQDEERKSAISHAMALIAKGDAVGFRAFEKSFKEHGIELNEAQKAMMIGQAVLAGTLERLGTLGEIESKVERGEKIPHPSEVVTRPGPRGETEFFTGVPETERIKERTVAAAEAQFAPEVVEARKAAEETLSPMKAFERKYFANLSDEDKTALVQRQLLPSLDQLTVSWILDQENSEEIIGDLVKQRTEPAPPKQRTVPVPTEEGLAWQVQKWDGKQWTPDKKAALRPINELSTREIILNLARLQQIKKSLDMAAQYPGMAAVLGVEGMDAATIEQGIQMLQEMLKAKTGEMPTAPGPITEPDPLGLLPK